MRRSFQIGVLLALLTLPALAEPGARLPLTPIDLSRQSQPLTIPVAAPVARRFMSRQRAGLNSWKVTSGRLPNGLQLSPEGNLTGTPTQPGSFSFQLSAHDSAGEATFGFTIVVIAPEISIIWKQPPHIDGENIAGTVEFSSRLSKPADVTVIIVAVNEVNKAFALGYQHFKFAPGARPLVIPFGSLLPFGKYIIHADAVAEVPPKSIYRTRQQTTAPLTIVQQ